jgi:hypothetical protein
MPALVPRPDWVRNDWRLEQAAHKAQSSTDAAGGLVAVGCSSEEVEERLRWCERG